MAELEESALVRPEAANKKSDTIRSISYITIVICQPMLNILFYRLERGIRLTHLLKLHL